MKNVFLQFALTQSSPFKKNCYAVLVLHGVVTSRAKHLPLPIGLFLFYDIPSHISPALKHTVIAHWDDNVINGIESSIHNLVQFNICLPPQFL